MNNLATFKLHAIENGRMDNPGTQVQDTERRQTKQKHNTETENYQ